MSFLRNCLFRYLVSVLVFWLIDFSSLGQSICSETEVRTEVVIHASADTIWKVLADFDSYPIWQTFLTSVSGRLEVGKKIHFTTLNEDSTSGKFSAFLLEADTGKLLSWGGSAGFIFRAKHYFILEKVGIDSVKLIQGEYWKGWLGKRYGRKIYKETFRKFEQMNAVLKRKMEEEK